MIVALDVVVGLFALVLVVVIWKHRDLWR